MGQPSPNKLNQKTRRGENIVRLSHRLVVTLFALCPMLFAACRQEDPTRHYEINVQVKRLTGDLLTADRCNDYQLTSSPTGRIGYFADHTAWQVELTGKPGDKVQLYFEFPCGYASARGEIILTGELRPTVTLQLERKQDTAITGRVIDSNGHPIKGAHVSGVNPATEKLESAPLTGGDGEFELPFKAGNGQQIDVKVTFGKKNFSAWWTAGHHNEAMLQ